MKGENHEVVNGTEIIPGLCLVYFAVGSLTVGIGDFRQGGVQPVVRPTGTDFRFAHRSEVLIHATLVRRPHFFLESTNLFQVVIQHAGLAAKSFALGINAALGFLEKRSEDLAALAHGGKLDTIRSPG